MSLSIKGAASKNPTRIGAIVGGKSYTYEELYHLTAEALKD